MTRPTVVPPPGIVDLDDEAVPDFLDAHERALVAFLDPADDASGRLRARLEVVAARHERPGFAAAAVDVARHRLVAEALGVKGIPTVVLFERGREADRVMGAAPEHVLDAMLQESPG